MLSGLSGALVLRNLPVNFQRKCPWESWKKKQLKNFQPKPTLAYNGHHIFLIYYFNFIFLIIYVRKLI